MKKHIQHIFVQSSIAIVVLLSIGYFMFYWIVQKAENEMLENSLEKVETIADAKLRAIDDYYDSLSSTLDGLEALILHDLNHHDIIHDYSYTFKNNDLDNSLIELMMSNDLYNILILSLDGEITYSYKKESDLHTNILSGIYQNSPLNEAFINALLGKKVFSQFLYYPPSNKEAAFLAKPVKLDGKTICIVAIQIDAKKLHTLLNDYYALGKSGEVVTGIMKDDLIQFMNPLRFGEKAFSSQATILSTPIALAVKGESGKGYILDRRGVEVGAVWRYSQKLGWGLVVKIDKMELLSDWNRHTHKVMIFLGVYSILLIFLLGYLYFLLLFPLKKLTSYAKQLSRGQYDSRIVYDKNNEFGVLANTLKTLSHHIRENLSRLQAQNFLLQKQKKQIQNLNFNLEKEVDEKTKQLQEYIHIVDQNVITSTTNEYGIITYVSDAFCEISGYTREELLGQNHRIIRHQDMDKNIFEELWNTISSGQTWKGVIKNRKKDEDFYWVETVITPNYVQDKIVGYTAIRHDITAQKLNEILIITDPLTGLYNRRYFNEIMEKEILRSRRLGSSISFMMIDIDYFKNYNDFYGHIEGDVILTKIASIIKEHTMRAGDYSFRLGGEEFGVILTSVDIERASLLAETIRSAIESENIKHEKSPVAFHITISIGLVSLIPDETTDMKTLYKLADDHLYRAKEKGRNCISF